MGRYTISLLVPIAAGVLHYLAFPPLNLWPLAFVSLVPLFLFLWLESSWRRVVWGAFLYCITYAVLSIIFILDPLLLIMGALLWLLIFMPWVLLLKRYASHPVLFFVLVPFAIVSAEYFAGNFSFLPAFLIMSGTPLGGTPFQFVALLGGLAAASLFVAFVNAAGASAVLFFAEGKKRGALLCAGVAFLLLAGGVALFFVPHPEVSLPKILTITVGDEFDTVAKKLDDSALARTPEGRLMILSTTQALLAPIGEVIEKEKPELVVLPEEMIDLRLPGVSDPKAREQLGITNAGPLLAVYSAFAAVHRVNLLATLITFEEDGGKYLSTVSIDKEGNFTGIYHKRLLTIVSEYWPFGNWLPFYWRWKLDYLPHSTRPESFIAENPTGLFSRGALAQEPLSVEGVKVGTLICLEGHFPHLYSRWRRDGAELIVYSGSNVWLPRGREIYRAFESRMRVLESIATGLPVIAAARGEYPGIVLPSGEVIGAQGKIESPFSWTYAVSN